MVELTVSSASNTRPILPCTVSIKHLWHGRVTLAAWANLTLVPVLSWDPPCYRICQNARVTLAILGLSWDYLIPQYPPRQSVPECQSYMLVIVGLPHPPRQSVPECQITPAALGLSWDMYCWRHTLGCVRWLPSYSKNTYPSPAELSICPFTRHLQIR